MSNVAYRWTLNLSTLACLILLYLIFTGQGLRSLTRITHLTQSEWQAIKTVFVSIFLEALPFMLLGVIVSALLNLFVSETALTRLLPRNPLLGVLCACLLGILLPVCECGMIPIVRRLIRKGMPVYIGITYILAAPIINPVTYLATYMAFRTMPEMALYRTLLAFVATALIGLVLYRTSRGNPLREAAGRKQRTELHEHDYIHHHHHHHHLEHNHEHVHDHNHDHDNELDRHHHRPNHHRHEGSDHSHTPNTSGKGSLRLVSICTHAADEFFEMGKFLMLGAFLTAFIQTFVSRSELLNLSGGDFGSHILMMGFAYLISLCSTSDAFVAASFSGFFPKSALLAFLVYGPMVDFKNTLMLLSVFKSRFVLRLIVLITVVVLTVSLLAGYWLNHSL